MIFQDSKRFCKSARTVSVVKNELSGKILLSLVRIELQKCQLQQVLPRNTGVNTLLRYKQVVELSC